MATVIVVNAVLFVIIGSIWVGVGVDLKKRSSWMLGLYAFISGFLVGLVRNDGAGGHVVVMNLTTSLQGGLIFTLVYMVGGAVTRLQRNKAQKYIDLAEESYQEQLENLAVNLFKDESSGKSGKSKE